MGLKANVTIFRVIRFEEGHFARPVTYLLLGRVGDALMATSFMFALKRRYPEVKYRLVCFS